MTKMNIFLVWLLGSIPLMLIVSVLALLFLNYTPQTNKLAVIPPIDNLLSMAFQVPVGWFFSFLTPLGWINILMMGLSVYLRMPILLTGSAITTILSGILWPATYDTISSL